MSEDIIMRFDFLANYILNYGPKAQIFDQKFISLKIVLLFF
jgi:hypothetical protein